MSHAYASSFCVTGQFLGYEIKGHKIYRAHLRCGLDEYRLKLSREAQDDLLRAALEGNLQIGNWIEVSGLQEMDRKTGLMKFKVYSLRRCDDYGEQSEPESRPTTASPNPSSPPKTKVLVCQKSNCCKRGGKALMQQLHQVVGDRQLESQVTIKGTGCMGQCKQGPVMVIGKTRYRQVQAAKVAHLLDAHMG